MAIPSLLFNTAAPLTENMFLHSFYVLGLVLVSTALAQNRSPICVDPLWDADTVYVEHDRVTYDSKTWEAQYWTKGDHPEVQDWGPWKLIHPCEPGATPSPTPSMTPGPTPDPEAYVVASYFVQWGIYERGYFVKQIHTSGSASRLTHVLYAFGNVLASSECALYDPWADIDRPMTAPESVDGKADKEGDELKGNFNQLRKLKVMYPHLKVLFSFGGWTLSQHFGAASRDAERFAESCYNLLHDPRWNGLFDGIDIDWEYPNADGKTPDNSGRDAYARLMKAVKTRFGSELVTSAITGDATNGGKIDRGGYEKAKEWVDRYFVMTYDYFGAWAGATGGPTAPHAPLTSYPNIPIADSYADAAIQKLFDLGIPAKQLVLGVPFYGRGWTGVVQAEAGGSATGPGSGRFESGIQDYKLLINECPATGLLAGTAIAYCPPEWWSYDTVETVTSKVSYAKLQELGGVFSWELSGDSTDGKLLKAMSDGMKQDMYLSMKKRSRTCKA